MHRITRLLAIVIAVAMAAAACGDEESSSDVVVPALEDRDIDGTSITVLAHDSFAISDDALAAFTAETGVSVTIQTLGDTGTMISEAILTKDNPLGDVLYGIDNTFLQRGLDAQLFATYTATNIGGVIDGLDIDELDRVTPINFGDVCVNYWLDAIPGDTPTSLEDLADPANVDQLVVQSPETSSPGLAFLLATIAGTDDWEQYWADLRTNGVSVTSGWEDAYYGEFTAGGGDRSMVVSYASSPPAEVIFAAEPVDSPPTGVLLDSCFRQIEFAGILNGADNLAGAAAFIDFLLTPTFQEEIPLSMFVFPALEAAELPQEFVDHAKLAESPHMLDPAEIEANRDAWVDRWVEIVLG